jgi:hypothetical protein
MPIVRAALAVAVAVLPPSLFELRRTGRSTHPSICGLTVGSAVRRSQAGIPHSL